MPRLFGREGGEGNEHLLERDAAVLECARVVLNVVVVVVRIGEEVLVAGVDVAARQVGRGESEFFWRMHFVYLLCVVIQILAYFVTEVGIGVFVSYYLDWIVDADGAVVGGKNYFISQFGESAEDVDGR